MKSKHLSAKKIDFPEKLVKIKLQETKNTYAMEGEVKWVDSLFESIDKKGMLHPILVCREEALKDGNELDTIVRAPVDFIGVPWRVVIGNNRYFYALDRNYDSMDAYEIKTKEDFKLLHNNTVLEAHQF